MQEIERLKRALLNIKYMGWVESMRSGSTGVGYTLESLLGQKENNLPIADFNGVELKSIRKYSKQNLHLFCAVPDGDYLYPIPRILSTLGYPDTSDREIKVFHMTVNAKRYTNIGFFKKMILKVDKENKQLRLIAKSFDGTDIPVNISWSFDYLNERINKKLKYLCVVEARNKIINGKEYFYYSNFNFYKIKSFDDFIFLLEKGIISVTFKIGYHKEKEQYGKIHDRGTDFFISYGDITFLYKKV